MARGLPDSKVRRIAKLLNQGKTHTAIGKIVGVSRSAVGSIAEGRTRKAITGFGKFSVVGRHKGGGVKKLPHHAHQTESVPGTNIKLRTSMIDKISRRMIEDSPFQKEWMDWWLARGRAVIAADDNDWASMMNITSWEYIRSMQPSIEHNQKILDLLRKKTIRFPEFAMDWKVKVPTKQE